MTGTTTVLPVRVVRPPLRRAPFAAELGDWLGAGIAARQGAADEPDPARPAVVIVPEYLRAAPPALLDDLRSGTWAGRTVGLVGYAGRTRARFALEDARDALQDAGARVVAPSLGIDVARWRTVGFDEADVLLRDLVLDELAPG